MSKYRRGVFFMGEKQNDFNDSKAAWSALYKIQLSDEEVRQINNNIFDFFRILKKWDEEVIKNNEQTPANNN